MSVFRAPTGDVSYMVAVIKSVLLCNMQSCQSCNHCYDINMQYTFVCILFYRQTWPCKKGQVISLSTPVLKE